MKKLIAVNLKKFLFSPLKNSQRNIIFSLILAPIGTIFYALHLIYNNVSSLSIFFYDLALFELSIYCIYLILIFPILLAFQILLKYLNIYCIFTITLSYFITTLLVAAFFTFNQDFSQKFLLALSFTIPILLFYLLFSFCVHLKNSASHTTNANSSV